FNAEYIATGHYAAVNHSRFRKRYILKKAKDKKKDQSYFLFRLKQAVLKKIIFPLSDLSKDEVRSLAKNLRLKTHNRPDSQEVCFISGGGYKDFLIKEDPSLARPGPVIFSKTKEVLGQHMGIAFYTIGQRRGLAVAYKEPLYVTAIDKTGNAIIVGTEKETCSSGLLAERVNWVSAEKIDKPVKVMAQIRYNQQPARAMIGSLGKDKAKVEFAQPQKDVAPGQAVVFYKEEVVLGGGIISKVIK
ncbi:MAG: tRNA 2-thiouridine(34) synthase MnmA, partial [Candidatus Omnitrophica bacterium]|nr:tRNA 2-thiouridine(34) synthase MnmA [Candidatus Omnitrophota bacterium]